MIEYYTLTRKINHDWYIIFKLSFYTTTTTAIHICSNDRSSSRGCSSFMLSPYEYCKDQCWKPRTIANQFVLTAHLSNNYCHACFGVRANDNYYFMEQMSPQKLMELRKISFIVLMELKKIRFIVWDLINAAKGWEFIFLSNFIDVKNTLRAIKNTSLLYTFLY